MQNVYIATLRRSGSTLLGIMLGAHSCMCHIGESAYWEMIDYKRARCSCGIYGCSTLVEFGNKISTFPDEVFWVNRLCTLVDMLEEPGKVRHELSLSFPNSADFEVARQNESTYFERGVHGLNHVAKIAAEFFKKDIVIENSKHIRIGEYLLVSHLVWKVIVLVRDPRGIAWSSKKAGLRKGVPRPISEKLPVFLTFARQVMALRAHPRVLIVRYEDLCKNTKGTLERICAFLDVRFEMQMMQPGSYKGHFLKGNRLARGCIKEITEDLEWQIQLTKKEKELFKQPEFMQAYAALGYVL